MKYTPLFHLLPFGLCLWYLFSYVLQPFPANGIAAVLIGVLTVTACRHPGRGAITAVFLTPLTLSLGRHLNTFFGDHAPPYLPYAEIVLISVLWGWIWKVLLNFIAPGRFPLAPKARTPAERLLLCIFGLWAVLALVGVFPALYRNLATSPVMPLQLLAVKLAFAPVWGMADEFFPLTAALRVSLAWCMVYYTQRLIPQPSILPAMVRAFCLSLGAAALYGVIQCAAGIGYSKWGNPAFYLQSTFHENESFASFCLVALVMVLAGMNDSLSRRQNAYYFILCLLYIMGIILSASRAIMMLGLVCAGGLLLHSPFRSSPLRWNNWKTKAALVASIPLIWFLVVSLTPHVSAKVEQLTNVLTATSEYLQEEKNSETQSGSLTLVARLKLWTAAGRMFLDSWGAGMGTGSYYRMTGTPLYQAISFMENAHCYWLQMLAELGLTALLPVSALAVLPLWIWMTSSFFHPLPLGLAVFWFCNGVGQSLLQQEILWLYALLLGAALAGPSPRSLADGWNRQAPPVWFLLPLGFLLLTQGTLWSVSLSESRLAGLDYQNTHTESYGYDFDGNGHRYLKVGRILRESVDIPMPRSTIEFRLRSAFQDVSPNRPQPVRVHIVDSHHRTAASGLVNLTSPDRIESLFLTIPGHEGETLTTLILPERVVWEGNMLSSRSRQAAGLYYYGFRPVYPESKD